MVGYDDQRQRSYTGGLKDGEAWYDQNLSSPSSTLILEIANRWCATNIDVPCSEQERQVLMGDYIKGFFERREKVTA